MCIPGKLRVLKPRGKRGKGGRERERQREVGDKRREEKTKCIYVSKPGPVDEWNKLLYHEIMRDLLG
jgi:hypothetical protein